MFEQLFKRPYSVNRHTNAPLLKERLLYLQYWAKNGAVENSLKRIAQYLLVVMEYLNFNELRIVSISEIEKAAEKWAKKGIIYRHKIDYSKSAKARFIRDASSWLNMIGCLKKAEKNPIPFEEYLTAYVAYIRVEQGLSENTIDFRIPQIKDFLIKINEKQKTFIEVIPLDVDEILTIKFEMGTYSRSTIQSYASVIRSFLRYAEKRDWCHINLADSIKAPRVYRYESLPSSPSWNDVKKILISSEGNHPTDIRDRAILMLLSMYGMRCSEVTHLRLEALDWENELLYLRRAKGSKPQIFPLSKSLGEAILRYLKEVRPNNCALREVFLCMRAPYRPLSSSAVYLAVSRRLKALDVKIKHYGPHSLRHACASHLLNEGVSLKEISDHLGHQGLETTRIYAKIDLVNLRKVAEFELGDLL